MTDEEVKNRDENVSLRLARALQEEHGIAKAIGLLSMAKDVLEWQLSVLMMSTIKAAGWKLEIVDTCGDKPFEEGDDVEGTSK